MKRPVAFLLMALLAIPVLPIAGCASGGGDGGSRLTAYFSRAVALYPHSRVKLMGVNVGTVRSIEVEGNRIRVEMHIDGKVPLPVDVNASIVPLSLIGERNVVLSPPWRPGMRKLTGDAVIPLERTRIPVEPDEALQAVTDLARAIDPDAVRSLVSNGAAALAGRGDDLNEALRQTADLASLLAANDKALLAAAGNVHRLAETLNRRREQLGRLLDGFATVTGTLADERASIARFLAALADLTAQGKAIITRYQTQLPQDLASLARAALAIQVNADSVQQLVRAVDEIGSGVVAAYDPDTGGARVRFTGTPTTLLALQAIFDLLGLGEVPCVSPLGDVECP